MRSLVVLEIVGTIVEQYVSKASLIFEQNLPIFVSISAPIVLVLLKQNTKYYTSVF